MAIELRGPTPSDNRRKARREANSGTTTAASPAGVLPPSGLSTAAEAASTLPPPVANDGALGDRYLQGVEVGVGGGQGPSSPSPAIDTARWARDLLNAEQVGAFLRGEGGAR